MSTIRKRRIGHEDVEWWTGQGDTTYQAMSTSGWNTTLHKVGGLQDNKGNIYSSLTEAIDIIGDDERTLIIPSGTWEIGTDTVPATLAVVVNKGGYISVNSGSTLTINGNFTAGPYHVFNGDGSIVWGPCAVVEVYPEWWGIDGTADEVEINKAMTSLNSLGGTVKLTRRGKTNDYTIADTINVAEGVRLTGAGMPTAGSADTMGTYITATSDVTDYAVDVYDSRGTLIENLYVSIDSCGEGVSAFAVRNCLNITLRDCTAIGVDTANQNGFYIEDGANRGPWQMRLERCITVGKSAHKLGNGFYVLGQNGTGHHAGKITFDCCWAKHTYDGFKIDYYGSGLNFFNCQAEGCGNDGAVFTNFNAGEGPPIFMGGEFNSNTGYGINGKVTTFNLSMNNNGTNHHSDVLRIRQNTQGSENDNYFRINKLLRTPGLCTDEGTKQTITAATDTITVPSQMVKRINSTTGDYTLTSSPTIEAYEDGKWLILYHQGNDTITIQDNAIDLGGGTYSGVKLLHPNTTLDMSYGDRACFYYNEDDELWFLMWYSSYNAATYAPTNHETDRAFDADDAAAAGDLAALKTVVTELANVLGTLIDDLTAAHIIKQ